MPKTFVLIRCTEWSPRVRELVAGLKESLAGWTILAVPDCLELSEQETSELLDDFDIPVYGITKNFVKESGLHFAHSGARTGWLCGDYVFYRVIDLDWDYAWIVEPDVYFLNGAEDLLKRLTRLDHDLLSTHLWPSGGNWMWGKALLDVIPGIRPHAMAFPFSRVSKSLAKDGLKFRQKIARQYDGQKRYPNDEVVLATAAHLNDRSTLDIRRLYEEVFAYWSTVTRVSIDDVSQEFTQPLIVHSGQNREAFDRYLDSALEGALAGSAQSSAQLIKSLETASRQTLLDFIERSLKRYAVPG